MKTMTELIVWFQTEYPALTAEMITCDHHFNGMDELLHGSRKHSGSVQKPISLNPYHLEGGVWGHTMMVCKQAENASYEVRIAALLHDIGKPSTRAVNPKNGRVSFFNHDAVGAFMALGILKRPELGLSKKQQIEIFNMIALHTQIFKLTIEQLESAFTNKQEELDRFQQLGKADSGGRFYSIPSESKVDKIFWAKHKDVVEKEKEVVILCGLPGAGKSRWTHNNAYNRDTGEHHFTVSRDICILLEYYDLTGDDKAVDYKVAWEMVDQKNVDKRLQQYYKSAKDQDKVIVDMTHMSKKSRRKSLSHFGPEYKKKCVVFLPDMEELLLRNENICGKIIGRDVIEKMMKAFYPPTLEEFDEIEYVI